MERFPTVTICSNQVNKNINEWKYVEVALQMIEDECFNNNVQAGIRLFI